MPGEPEVGDLQHGRGLVLHEQQVLRLDVPVHLRKSQQSPTHHHAASIHQASIMAHVIPSHAPTGRPPPPSHRPHAVCRQ